jgi:diacylglycerol O-acyltransferase / wax synthase
MATPSLHPRLTADDASFLYLERKEMPLHIGSVSIFEGPLPLEKFIRLIDSKLHLIPRYRQRVIPAPFNVGHPSWEDDPQFDIRNHIFELDIDAPGDDAALRELSGRLFSGVMDRNKPLWSIHLIKGLENGRSALLCKVHHCMVDGVSGVGLMGIMMDTSHDMPILSEKPEFAPRPLPTPTELYFSALSQGFSDTIERMIAAQTSYMNLLQTFLAPQTSTAMQQVAPLLAELAIPPARLPFNKPCSGERRITWNEFAFSEARAIRGALGGTVNDVALTVLSGAVAKYVRKHGFNTSKQFCRFMCPVNVRREEQRGRLGNQVSALLVNVPLDIDDPAARLTEVNRRTETLKNSRLADLLHMMATWAGAIPAPLQAMVAALPFVQFASPIFNMVCTNVPGPQIPLYALGQEMLTYYPHVPCGNDMGMNCAIQSYNHKLAFGITSDAAAAPDAVHMRDFLDESFNELRRAAGLPEVHPETHHKVQPRPVRTRKKAVSVGD